MKIIGAGLPRTATLTQKVALEMLGLGPCYHMVDVLSDLSRVAQWADALRGGTDWNQLFAGYQATVDWPSSFFYRELIEVFPEAKVLLSVRPSADWARSVSQTILEVLHGDNIVHDLSSARCRVDPGWRDYTDLMTAMWEKGGLHPSTYDAPDQAVLIRAFDRYNDEVRQTVPADRLLVWSAADGWEPLCEFFDVPVPPAPMPMLNDSKTFTDRIIGGSLAVLGEWFGKTGGRA